MALLSKAFYACLLLYLASIPVPRQVISPSTTIAPVGVLPKFEIAYFVLLAGLVAIQIQTIITMFRLDRKLLQEERKPVPAVSLAA